LDIPDVTISQKLQGKTEVAFVNGIALFNNLIVENRAEGVRIMFSLCYAGMNEVKSLQVRVGKMTISGI